jgi:predicted metal-binding membrane protein
MAHGIASDRIVLATAALLFIGSAAVTLAWCGSMAAMDGMEMPGGWIMSMSWMRMPGQGWTQSAASFVGMWTLMLMAMMLPSLTPALRGHRPASAVRVAAAYFGVWTLLGVAVYPLGIAIADLEMQHAGLARLVPVLAALALAACGITQLSAWKLRQLDCCRAPPTRGFNDAGAAWRAGISLGLRCCACCAPLTAALLVLGVMDPGIMACATAAISLERLTPRGRAVARISGVLLLATAAASLLRSVA